MLVPQPQAQHETFALTDMQEAFLLGRQASIDGDTVGAHIYLEIDVKGPVVVAADKPRTDIEMIAKHAGGLIGFTGCLAGLIPQHLLHDRFEEARKLLA